MIHTEAPRGFAPRFEVVGCFLGCNVQILLLQRAALKPQSGTWGVPAGKMHEGETPTSAMLRELAEESGYVASAERLGYIRRLFVRYSDYDFVYHMFDLVVPSKPKVRLNTAEHCRFMWITPRNALKLPLIGDLDACIRLHYRAIK